MPRLRIAIFCFCAALCVVLLVPAQHGWCAEAKERYIKKLGVSDGYINLKVDGEKVRIPLPEGYEEFSKEDYPEIYNYYYGPVWSNLAVQLGGFINSIDNKRKSDIHIRPRVFFIDIERVYFSHRLSASAFKNEMNHLKQYESNNKFKKLYIYEDDISFSELRIRNEKTKNKSVAYTNSYFLFKKIIFTIRFYTFDKSINSAESLANETKKYIMKLGIM